MGIERGNVTAASGHCNWYLLVQRFNFENKMKYMKYIVIDKDVLFLLFIGAALINLSFACIWIKHFNVYMAQTMFWLILSLIMILIHY